MGRNKPDIGAGSKWLTLTDFVCDGLCDGIQCEFWVGVRAGSKPAIALVCLEVDRVGGGVAVFKHWVWVDEYPWTLLESDLFTSFRDAYDKAAFAGLPGFFVSIASARIMRERDSVRHDEGPVEETPFWMQETAEVCKDVGSVS